MTITDLQYELYTVVTVIAGLPDLDDDERARLAVTLGSWPMGPHGRIQGCWAPYTREELLAFANRLPGRWFRTVIYDGRGKPALALLHDLLHTVDLMPPYRWWQPGLLCEVWASGAPLWVLHGDEPALGRGM